MIIPIQQIANEGNGQDIRENILNELIKRWNIMGGGGVGLIYHMVGLISITGTTSETSMMDSGSSFGSRITSESNSLAIENSYRIKICGVYTNAGNNFTIRVKLNSVDICVIDVTPTVGSNLNFDLEVTLVTKTVGATGKIVSSGRATFMTSDGAPFESYSLSTDSVGATVNTTAPNTFDVTATPTSSSDVIDVFSASIEKITLKT